MPPSHPTRFMALYRASAWRADNRSMAWNNPRRVLCRSGGPQAGVWDGLLYEYANDVGWPNWQSAAYNREQWSEHELSFSFYARMKLNI